MTIMYALSALSQHSQVYMYAIICNIALVRDIYAISRYTKFGYVITAVIYYNNQAKHLYGCMLQSFISKSVVFNYRLHIWLMVIWLKIMLILQSFDQSALKHNNGT